MYVTREAHLARPDWKYLDPLKLRTTTEKPSKLTRCKKGLRSIGRAACRYYLGLISVEKEKVRSLKAKEEVRFCDVWKRAELVKEKIEDGYLGLGLWQQDLDRSRVDKAEPPRRHFQSLDEMVMAGVPRFSTEHKPAVPKEDTTKSAPTALVRQDESRVLFTATSTCSNRRARVHTKVDGHPILEYRTGEVFDMLEEYDKMWLAVKRGDRKMKNGLVVKRGLYENVWRFEDPKTGTSANDSVPTGRTKRSLDRHEYFPQACRSVHQWGWASLAPPFHWRGARCA